MSDITFQGQPYLRTPVISPDGQQIAFLYAADIWLVHVQGGSAERLTAHPSGHFAPRWSPDGEQLAFSSGRTGRGDIYILPLHGDIVRRVTFHDAINTTEAWSVDGRHIFFSSYRDQQNSAIYRVDARGGTPIKWIDQPYEQLNNLSISPDGSLLAFNLSRDPWWRRGPNPYGGAEVWVVSNDVDADDYRKISDYSGMNRWPMWAPDGGGLYFVSDRDGIENLWFQSLEGGPPRKVTSFLEGRLLWPTISSDGRTIVFERDFGIWKLDIISGTLRRLDIAVRMDTKITPVGVYSSNRDVSELALAPDGKKVAFVVRGEIFADFADKETDKERRQGPSLRVTNTSFRESDIAWSPNSRQLVYTSDRHGDAEVYLHDFATHNEMRLTNSPAPNSTPRYSPDGTWIAYARGEDEIRLVRVETGEDRPFVRANFTYGAHFAWSPDSKWLAYIAQDERSFSNLYVQRIDEQQTHQITLLSNVRAYRPLWAPNGQFIIFTTAQYRDEAQIARVDLRPQPPIFREDEFEKLFATKDEDRRTKEGPSTSGDKAPDHHETTKSTASGSQPTTPDASDRDPHTETPNVPPAEAQSSDASIKIVFVGIERRLYFLTPTQMDATAYCISPDSRDLIFSASVAGKANLWTMPLDELRQDQPPRQLTSGSSSKRAAQFAPDGKSFYFLESGQIMIRKFPSGDQTLLPTSVDVVVDFNQEKRQVFDESWRLLRDHFYDPTFRGLDWSAARTQFAPIVAGAQTPAELRTILNLMVGELRASHLGASFPWRTASSDGYIGLQFDRIEQATTGRLRIAGIVPDSPAALAGDGNDRSLRVGDQLVAVNGVELGPEVNLDVLLQRTVGRRVLLRVVSRSADHEIREIAVRPVSAEQYNNLQYRAWVYENEHYVHRISAGRLGYVHIREMSYVAYQRFLADLDAEIHSKEGVVVDARFNGGGHIATFILDVLARRSVLLSAFRDRPLVDAAHVLGGSRVLNKPTVLVTNESSGSNTEMFTEGYRRLGLGKVVGRPTAGAVIGTTERMLLDGTIFRLPYMKVATPEGEDLEGTGRAVDVEVTLPLGEHARGRDRQLDAAVATLIQQIDSGNK